jgi:hypothetical protein
MSHLLEIMTVEGYRVFFVQAQDSHRRPYFSAYVQIPEIDPMMGQIILDDRILPRLKDRIRQVMSIRNMSF